MQARLGKWRKHGFHFRLELLLRCIKAVLTGEALFSALAKMNTPAFQEGIKRVEKAIDTLLNLITSRLGLDHDRMLGSRYLNTWRKSQPNNPERWSRTGSQWTAHCDGGRDTRTSWQPGVVRSPGVQVWQKL
jgi:hypothetical protein